MRICFHQIVVIFYAVTWNPGQRPRSFTVQLLRHSLQNIKQTFAFFKSIFWEDWEMETLPYISSLNPCHVDRWSLIFYISQTFHLLWFLPHRLWPSNNRVFRVPCRSPMFEFVCSQLQFQMQLIGGDRQIYEEQYPVSSEWTGSSPQVKEMISSIQDSSAGSFRFRTEIP